MIFLNFEVWVKDFNVFALTCVIVLPGNNPEKANSTYFFQFAKKVQNSQNSGNSEHVQDSENSEHVQDSVTFLFEWKNTVTDDVQDFDFLSGWQKITLTG